LKIADVEIVKTRDSRIAQEVRERVEKIADRNVEHQMEGERSKFCKQQKNGQVDYSCLVCARQPSNINDNVEVQVRNAYF
jgi:hypothetical protein